MHAYVSFELELKKKVIAKKLTFNGIVHITTNTNKDSLKLSTTFWTISENSRYHTLILTT